jgi:DNA mismatch endonuclease (patch repair protein)
MDTLSHLRRSQLMARVRGKDTEPEMIVRRLAHAMGYRYRLHRKDLPGRPDLVFPGHHKIVFVHGCFWHRHSCKKATTPKSNVEFWKKKFEENIARDDRNILELAERGWDIMVIWQCETCDTTKLSERLQCFLGSRP